MAADNFVPTRFFLEHSNGDLNKGNGIYYFLHYLGLMFHEKLLFFPEWIPKGHIYFLNMVVFIFVKGPKNTTLVTLFTLIQN